ncbi:pyridoxine/pyridoxamine 5'-phosphate oxidase [Vulcanimicrobium alpinum]|uniref:Pyridoxamine 5'-phosphate oxidase n=1 Tax=Vulcanimicrobium alpinum TaxID=3016050 RepID=A0AAN1XWA9_UNVUL|nr:pyridoxamine 5'-phosphate oxidase [Vulcanimicrobium alpinum]BDE06559.1 pyridoxine/pyridoxamine 5'-phosphate oxidase [Vulcanimicrobium alpinum]
MNDDLLTRRLSYERGMLDEGTVSADPFAQFDAWLSEALAMPGIVEPNAMSLATVGDEGRPSSRIVLLRQWDGRGFVFYTNYESRKGGELAHRPAAALLFWWGALERQIRIEGRVERVDNAESDAYFATRPRGHRLSAWASPQSRVVSGKDALEAAMAEAEARFAGDVPRPPHWGGYRVVPDRFEFWQGRPNRVHDRVAYERVADGWTIARLAP